jgi:hypothetical protein
LQGWADIQIHDRSEHAELHGVDRFVFSKADIVHNSKHISASCQLVRESSGLILISKIC